MKNSIQYASLILTLFTVSATSSSAAERILNIKQYNNINETFSCVKRTQPPIQEHLEIPSEPVRIGLRAPEYVAVNNVQFRNGEQVLDEINLENYWAVSQSLDECRQSIHDPHGAIYFDQRNGFPKLVSLFNDTKSQEKLVFKDIYGTCYRKDIKIVSRSKSFYYHPVTGLQPESLESVKIAVPCPMDSPIIIDY